MKWPCRVLVFCSLSLNIGWSQIPESAQVNLYFPQLADGGSRAQQWRTKLTFVNPNNEAASVILQFFGDDDGPLGLDFGGGKSSQLSFIIVPAGRAYSPVKLLRLQPRSVGRLDQPIYPFKGPWRFKQSRTVRQLWN
jgi:hypothetical protein